MPYIPYEAIISVSLVASAAMAGTLNLAKKADFTGNGYTNSAKRRSLSESLEGSSDIHGP